MEQLERILKSKFCNHAGSVRLNGSVSAVLDKDSTIEQALNISEKALLGLERFGSETLKEFKRIMADTGVPLEESYASKSYLRTNEGRIYSRLRRNKPFRVAIEAYWEQKKGKKGKEMPFMLYLRSAQSEHKNHRRLDDFEFRIIVAASVIRYAEDLGYLTKRIKKRPELTRLEYYSLIKEGLLASEIGEERGTSKSAVHDYMKTHGLKRLYDNTKKKTPLY